MKIKQSSIYKVSTRTYQHACYILYENFKSRKQQILQQDINCASVLVNRDLLIFYICKTIHIDVKYS